jgi:segregation and condensation protein A
MSEKFTLETPAFIGPLEALLNMIEDRKMSISDISLSEVTDAYLAYVEKLPELPLGETAQFILVASTLLLIKSRTLLPSLELSVEERESVEELERRLARYAIVRNAAKVLRRQWGKSPLILATRAPLRPAIFNAGEASKNLIHEAAIRLIKAIPKPEALAKAAIAPVLALEDVIQSLRNRLSMAVRTRFSDLTRNASDRHEVIVYFLAMLELVRSGSASVTQDKLFSDITIEIEAATGAPRYGL